MPIIQDPEDVEEFAREPKQAKSIPARMVKCLFCGKAGPWWECNCVAVQEVRAGKRAKPRVVFRDGVPVIIVDRETVAANHLGLKRYPANKGGSRKTRGLDPVNSPVHSDKSLETNETENPPVHTNEAVNTDPVHKTGAVNKSGAVDGDSPANAVHRADPVNTEDARKAYRREWMRRKREGG